MRSSRHTQKFYSEITRNYNVSRLTHPHPLTAFASPTHWRGGVKRLLSPSLLQWGGVWGGDAPSVPDNAMKLSHRTQEAGEKS